MTRWSAPSDVQAVGTVPSLAPPTGGVRFTADERLGVLCCAIGLFAVNIDLDTVRAPAALPLSTLTWSIVAGSWAVPLVVFRRATPLRPDGATWWLFALFAFAVMSAVWSIHPARSAASAVASGITFVGAWVASAHLGWRRFVRVASVALAAFTALGLVRDVVIGDLVSSLPAVVTGERRFSGLTFSPTDLGRIAGFTVLLSALAVGTTTGRRRRFHLAAAAVGVGALVTSGTRLAAFALMCVAVVAVARRRSPTGLTLVAATGLAIAAVATSPGTFVDRLGRPGEPDDHVLEFAGRTPIWTAAVDLWSERPLLGHGWASNERVFAEAFARDALGFDAYTAHNLGVGVLVDLGAIGLTLLVVGLVAAWRTCRHRPDARLVLLLVVLTGTIEATFSRPALVMALVAAVIAPATAAPSPRPQIDV